MPKVACEMRRASSFIRFLLPFEVYPEFVSDSHSSASVMLWALRGYNDSWFNFNLPGLTGAGQRGHELGAMAVFARAMGAAAFWVKVETDQLTLHSLDEAPYIFDGQTSVVMGPDEKIVRYYVNLINSGLRKEIVIESPHGRVILPLHRLLVQLYNQFPAVAAKAPIPQL